MTGIEWTILALVALIGGITTANSDKKRMKSEKFKEL